MTFWQWLRRQKKRDDRIGDLSRDAISDPQWPSRAWKVTTLHQYLMRCGACDGAHESLSMAINEWRKT